METNIDISETLLLFALVLAVADIVLDLIIHNSISKPSKTIRFLLQGVVYFSAFFISSAGDLVFLERTIAIIIGGLVALLIKTHFFSSYFKDTKEKVG